MSYASASMCYKAITCPRCSSASIVKNGKTAQRKQRYLCKFDAESFRIDWDKQQAICPEGKTSLSWTPAVDHMDNEVIKIKFSSFDCKPCPSRIHCTTSKRLRRTVTIRSQEAYEALAFDQRSLWLFEACSCKPASEGLPPSLAQHRG